MLKWLIILKNLGWIGWNFFTVHSCFLSLLCFSLRRPNVCFPLFLLLFSAVITGKLVYFHIRLEDSSGSEREVVTAGDVLFKYSIEPAFSHVALWRRNCGVHSSLQQNTAVWRVASDRSWHLSPVRPDAAWKIHSDEELEEIDISPATFTSGRARWAELTLVMDARSWQT